ncbi:hypothetical protein Lsai_3158 [Legionella sainthelensi]|uniref:Uncharacterized protein n=1 Tax=Legionella sainthelensi TaxID=28087 RepID=A0A0W0YBW9_9GAMM|nr:hypothetical protein [Legionella sainthelensi]KTD54336.1 hypothetical protein Lsai_3158 [Legionella sainthelensi]VEH30573.1 Uncharacterised protein [Legionella sainthelensi]
MKNEDPALTISNPRLLAAVYYGLLSVVGTILIDVLLTSLDIMEIVPLFQSIVLGVIVAAITGAIFGELIVHCPKPYKLKTFMLGFVMVLLSLPFFDLGLMYFIEESERPIFKITNFQDLFLSYLSVLGHSYILFGFLLAIAAGVASMYLRGLFVYQILHTDKRRSHRLPRYIGELDKVKAKPTPKKRTMQRKKTSVK